MRCYDDSRLLYQAGTIRIFFLPFTGEVVITYFEISPEEEKRACICHVTATVAAFIGLYSCNTNLGKMERSSPTTLLRSTVLAFLVERTEKGTE